MNHMSARVDLLPAPPVAKGANGFSVIGGYAAAIIHALEARGIPIDAILDASGIECVPSNDPLARIPLSSLHRLFDAAVAFTDDPYFGLYSANFLHPTNLHAVGLGLLASASLRELGGRLATYSPALSNAWQARLRECGDTVRLEYPRLTETPYLAEDSFGLFMIRLIRDLSDGRILPLAIDLNRPTPPDGGARHRRAFGCPLTFGAICHSVVYDAHALDISLPGACGELAAHNDQLVIAWLAKLDRNDIETRVRALLFQQLPLSQVTKEDIARQLCMSPRTLQVKLSKCNKTFQELVGESRRALACGYMRNSALSITEIAYSLGFSEPSNFSRAFRRWTGYSPRAYVTRLRNEASPSDER